jgi:polyhydroxyalkanoate synthesis regulator phasin
MAMAEWTEQIVRLMRESVNASVETAVKFQEQTWRMVDELVQRGAVAKEEGQRLLEMWTRRTEDFQARMEEKYRQWEESITGGLRGALPPTRKDLEELHRKLDQLMTNLEAVPGKGKGGRGEKKARKPKAKPAAKRR